MMCAVYFQSVNNFSFRILDLVCAVETNTIFFFFKKTSDNSTANYRGKRLKFKIVFFFLLFIHISCVFSFSVSR